jgi:hypothetical protein
MAEPFLSTLGFALINDLAEVDRLGETRAHYKSQKGFFLLVGFDPYDGQSAGITCGRKWTFTPTSPKFTSHSKLSNQYHVLARRFGFDLPLFYPLRWNSGRDDLKRILDDLETTLPSILERLTLADLIQIEREEYGCQWAQDRYGDQPPKERFTISQFPE